MKETYEKLELEIIFLEAEDVITTSGPDETENNTEGYPIN